MRNIFPKRGSSYFLLPIATLALLALANIVPAQAGEKPDPKLLELQNRIQSKLRELQETAGFPGATVGFVLADGRSGSVAVGVADREAQIPMRPSSRMFAGSIGKTYASAVMLQLVQEGKADLDSKISH